MTPALPPAWTANPWWLVLGLLAVALGAWLATGAVLRLLVAWQVYDEPNHRSSHVRPKPRGGGLALIPLILAVWAAAALAGVAPHGFWLTIGGSLLLAAISWADDLKSRPASLRFGMQIAAVVLGLWALDPSELVFQGLLPPFADRLLTGLIWLWFINLFNFMDGIDGITGVETITVAGGLALVAAVYGGDPSLGFIAAVPAAAALGFLYWNWAPSRIFLGDVGSVPLGYLLGWLLVAAAVHGHWAAALILPLYYLADASWTLVRRAARGERVWQAHREHFYQRAVQRGFSHAAVARLVLAANVVLVAIALLSATAPAHRSPGLATLGALALALLAVVALLFMLAKKAPPAGRQPKPGDSD